MNVGIMESFIGILLDVGLFAGIGLLIASFTNRYKHHRLKFITLGCILILLWAFFVDWAELQTAYQQGVEAGRGNLE